MNNPIDPSFVGRTSDKSTSVAMDPRLIAELNRTIKDVPMVFWRDGENGRPSFSHIADVEADEHCRITTYVRKMGNELVFNDKLTLDEAKLAIRALIKRAFP